MNKRRSHSAAPPYYAQNFNIVGELIRQEITNSAREAESLVKSGEIRVNGVVVESITFKLDQTDILRFRGNDFKVKEPSGS